MSTGTQSERMACREPCRTARRVCRASRLAASILALALLVLVNRTIAQEGTNQAGLVVQFSDGSLYTACLDLGPDGQATGEELLRASGMAAAIDYGTGLGGTVCKIGNEGCGFPAQPCFCQCTMKPGEPCVYWAYFHLVDGQWRYANQGVSTFIVRPGDVQGWAWGPGTTETGVQLPLITFEQICSAPPEPAGSTATSAPLAPPTTPAPQPTATPAVPTDTPLPSATPSSNPTATSLLETPSPSPTPAEVATTTATPKPTASVTAAAAAGVSATPSRTSMVVSPSVELGAPALADEDQHDAALPPREASGASGGTSSYLFFGALAVALVGGLIFLQFRQRRSGAAGRRQ